MDITVTIVSWNTRELLRACLQSLHKPSDHYSVEVHVVDNNSSDGSQAMVCEQFPNVKLIANDENLGYTCANNISWHLSSARYWMLLNSDTVVRPGAIDALIRFMDLHPNAGLATARLVNEDNSLQFNAQHVPSIIRPLVEATRLHRLLPKWLRGRLFLEHYWTYDAPLRLGWTWATALISRREAVVKIGPLCEDLFYALDLEWSMRMRRRGWEIWFCPDAEVLHYGGRSSKQRWDADALRQIVVEGTRKALKQHMGRTYLKALNLSLGLALAVDRAVCWYCKREPQNELLQMTWQATQGAPQN